MQTRTRTRTSTHVVVALIAGAGLMAAAGFALTSFRPPALTVRLTPGQRLSTEVISGASDTTLLSFDLTPRGGSAEVDQIVFSVFGDSDADFAAIDRDADPADRFTQCTLQDTSGATVAGPVPVLSGYLTFADPFTVASGAASTYEVHCDLSNSPLVDDNADRFAASIGGEPGFEASIGGTVLSGSSLVIGKTTYDTLNSLGEISIVVEDHGNMTVSLAGDTPSSTILIGDSSNNLVAKFDARARGEDFHIDTITFDLTGDFEAVDHLNLACGEGPDLFSHISAGYPVDGRVVFSSPGCDVLSTEEHVTFELYADITTVGVESSSGDSFKVALQAVDAGTFEAVGQTSGTTYTESDLAAVVTAQKMVVRNSKPEFSFQTSPSTALVPGVGEIFRFDVAAHAAGNVEVSQVLFKVTSTDNASTKWNACGDGTALTFATGSRWALYDTSDFSTAVSDTGDWVFLKADGKPCQATDTEPVAYAMLNLERVATNPGLSFSAGASGSYAVKVDTTGASAVSDDSIMLGLISEQDAFAIKQHAALWDDTDVGATGINAYLLNIFPLTGEAMTF
jgi:hypothetical protein